MIHIKFWDSSDICGFAYSTGYKNSMNLLCDFRVKEYPYTEEGVENGDGEFVPAFQKVVKEYQSSKMIVSPAEHEMMEHIQLCRFVQVFFANGDNQFVKYFKVENVEYVENREYVQLTVSFQTSYEINRSKQIQIPNKCDINQLTAVDYVIANALALPALLPFYEGMRVLNTDIVAHQDIYRYNSATGLWERTFEVAQEKFLTNNDDGSEYYFTGLFWSLSPDITTLTHVIGDTYKIKGNARIGFVRIEYSTDAGLTWATLIETTSGIFKGGLLEIDLLPTYDLIRAVSYTHNCLESYGAMEVNPNSGDFITLTGLPLNTFNTNIGQTSAAQDFTMTEGVDAVGDVTLTAPTGFEISDDGLTYTNSLAITAGYGMQDIYVVALGTTSGTFSGTIEIEVDGKVLNVAVSKVVACSIAWIEDFIEDVNGEDVGTLQEDLDYLDDTKDLIGAAIVTMGGAVAPADTFRSYEGKILGLAPVCADATANVTRDGVPYTSQNIPSGGSATIDVISAVSAGWNPPSDWGWDAASALITDSDNGFSSIYACYPDFPNYAAFTATFVGTGVVDWGDGSAPEAVTSGVKIEHEFNYAGITQAVTSEGWKPCVIKFESTGSFTILYLDNNAKPTNYGFYGTQKYKALKLRSQITTEFQYYNSTLISTFLEIIDFGTVLKVRLSSTFNNHQRLKKLIYNLKNNTSSNNVSSFQYCTADIDWNTFDFSGYTNLRSLWSYYLGGGGYMLDIAIDSCTDMYFAFAYDCGFTSIKLRNTGNLQIIPNIYSNPNIIHFEMDDCSALTNTANFIDPSNARNLQSLLLYGLEIGINLTNQPLTATALNAFFTSLGTAAGAQTIIVTGCLGAATCDTSIATGKGFTVTT
jgi:hypothetical protein